MTTPIVDFLNNYNAREDSRLHMPGHKGRAYLGFEPWDITEVKGADELYFADGIIAESEANASRLFGGNVTLYSTEGSSHGIRSMILLARQLFAPHAAHPRLLAARNAHKALLFACAICDLEVDWLYPSAEADNSVAACHPQPEVLRARLEALRQKGQLPFAVYVTSPDYLGQRSDIRALAAVSHACGCALLVDNAHGAYLHFLPEPQHPMDLGADLCCDSAHKTLPVVTGGAYLHVRRGLCTPQEAKNVMAMTGTSSPSYLILASLDRCNAELASSWPQRLAEVAEQTDAWKVRMAAEGIPLLESEQLKIVVCAAALGLTGVELGEILRQHRAEPEFCDADYLVCMITPDTQPVDLERLAAALREAKQMALPPRDVTPLKLRPLPRRCSIREAVLSPQRIVPVGEAVGLVCASPAVSCPPAVPIAVSGEEITAEAVRIMRAYGIETVAVCESGKTADTVAEK